MNRSSNASSYSLESCQFLANSYLTFLATLDYELTINNISQLLVPKVADWYAVYTLDTSGKMRLESCSHADPSKTDLIRELDRRFPFSSDAATGPAHVLRTKISEYVTQLPPPSMSGLFMNSEQVGLLELVGMSSYICVPLKDHEAVIGALFLVTNEGSGRRYTAADIPMLAEFAQGASFAIVNARSAGTTLTQFRELVDDLDAIVWESDITRTHYRFISKKAEEILGYSAQKWRTDPGLWQSIIHPADAYRVMTSFSAAASKGRDLDYEYRAIAQDGRTVWLRDILHIVHDSAGTATGVRGVIVNVTEQHQAMENLHQRETQLTQSQQLLTSITNGINAVLWESNLDRSVYHYVSGRTAEILGYPAELWLSEKNLWERIIHPDDRDRVVEDYLRAAASGRENTFEYRILSQDGQTRWIRDVFHFEKIESESASARGVVVDVTDNHEKALTFIRNETALGLFYVNVKDYAIIMMDKDGIITSWNVAAQNITGYSSEEATGQHLDLLFPDEERVKNTASMEIKEARDKGSVENNLWMKRKDGSLFWCFGVLTALFDEQKTLLGFIKFARDMTEQKKLEEELRKAKDAAEVASEAKSQFLANMSHELRTPLGAMIGFADELLDPELEESKRLQFISIIRRSGEQLVALIDDILDLSKVEAGQLRLDRQKVDIRTIISDVLTLLGSRAADKGLELRLVAQNPLPKTIQSDPARLRQILINIIGNAIKFTQAGWIEVQISAEPSDPSQASGRLIYIIKDTGPGIAPERQEQLFHAFVQADQSISRVYGGTGLGLVLSRRLARALGGNVELVASEPGKGSTFKIWIDTGPLDIEMIEAESFNLMRPSPEASTKEPDPKKPLAGVKVLVADDSEDNRLLINRILGKRGGAQVETVEDGQQAIDAALNGSYDVVLMDMQMPELDGFEATAKLRRKGYKKPIIALTAHAMKEERSRCLAAGCDDFLGKPINSKVLFEKLFQYSVAGHRQVPKNPLSSFDQPH